jgi:hypothetical protein
MKSSCSVLGKRKYGTAFHSDSFDDSRYGNHIGADFFKNGGVGHGIKINSYILCEERKSNSNSDSNNEEIYKWCCEYLENKKGIDVKR